MRARLPRFGFTIIELLVVISIIALLISILLPSLAGVRERARFVKWKASSHGMKIRPDVIFYANFEEQDGSQTITKGVNTHKRLWNRAVGDPLFASKIDWETKDYDATFGSANIVNSPTWTFTDARWKGKGGASFGAVALQQHISVDQFKGIESPVANSGILYDFSLIWSLRPASLGNYTQNIAIDDSNPTDVNANWARFLMHAGAGGGIWAGTGGCCTNRIDDTQACCTSGTLKVDQWAHMAYTRKDANGVYGGNDGIANFYTSGGNIVGGKQAQRTGHIDPNGAFFGLNIGLNNASTLHGVLDEFIAFKDEVAADDIADNYRAGAARKR